MKLQLKAGQIALCCALCLPAFAQAQNENMRRGPRVLADNLDNPSGVAIQPGTGDIFIAEHPGVARLTREGDGYSIHREIAKYPTDIYGKGPMYDIGPLGLAFLGQNQLVVGDGSRPDGEEVIRVYNVGNKALESPQSEDHAEFTLGPITPGDASAKGEGNYYAVAVTSAAIYVTANGDDTKGWVVRSRLEGGKPGTLEPFIATKEAVMVDAPCGIAVNQDGDLVVSQMGEISVPGDSLLTVYDAKTGKLKHSCPTGLNDIVGIAYSPDGKLFGVDFSWIDPKQGGLYELTMTGEKCSARKITSLDKPTALAFDKEGGLLVTLFGTAAEGSTEKPGKLVRIAPRRLQPMPQ